jgi:hypothetical protein
MELLKVSRAFRVVRAVARIAGQISLPLRMDLFGAAGA